MAVTGCNEDKYKGKDGICCDRCPAGTHVKTPCNKTSKTECISCNEGLYMDTKNYLDRCHMCKQCSSNKNEVTTESCSALSDTKCECAPGFYCNASPCDYCQAVTLCPPGSGVKLNATASTDTVCAPCERGTFSDTNDFRSPCREHTRCETQGRETKTQGTNVSNAVCGDFTSHCPWVLPAALWSGLVLTALIVIVLIIWREKRRSYNAAPPCVRIPPSDQMLPASTTSSCPFGCLTASADVAVALVEMVSAPVFPNGAPPQTVLNVEPDEPCRVQLLPTQQDHTPGEVASVNSHPITPLKASVSLFNGTAGPGHDDCPNSHSEPQEDEWCGT